MRRVTGRVHGRDLASLPIVQAAVSALPGYEISVESSRAGWQVSYAAEAATAQESWEIARRFYSTALAHKGLAVY